MTTFPLKAVLPSPSEGQVGVPSLARIKPGGFGDYQIVDELGRTVWASDWVRKAYFQTRPIGIIRGQRWG